MIEVVEFSDLQSYVHNDCLTRFRNNSFSHCGKLSITKTYVQDLGQIIKSVLPWQGLALGFPPTAVEVYPALQSIGVAVQIIQPSIILKSFNLPLELRLPPASTLPYYKNDWQSYPVLSQFPMGNGSGGYLPWNQQGRFTIQPPNPLSMTKCPKGFMCFISTRAQSGRQSLMTKSACARARI